MSAKIGSDTATVNGQQVKLSGIEKIENEKTVFPTAALMNFLKN